MDMNEKPKVEEKVQEEATVEEKPTLPRTQRKESS